MTTKAIVLDKLTKKYAGHEAIADVTLSVPAGSIFGYLGLNGAGKTTTINILTTLLRPTSGNAFVAGHEVTAHPLRVREVIGFAGEDASEATPGWTAREYLAYFVGLRHVSRRRAEIEASLDSVGLDSKWRSRPMATYSTGMRRRVEIGRALIGAPEVLFLDEPTRGLDLPGKLQVWRLLRGLVSEQGVTIFLSSHDAGEIRTLCSRIGILRHGRLVFEGSPDSLASGLETFEVKLAALLLGENRDG